MVDMKAFLFSSDAILSAITALLSFLLLVSLIIKTDEHFSRSLAWRQKEEEAYALSEVIAKRLAAPDGSLDVGALSHISRNNSQVRVGNYTFGPAPPENVSVFFSRRVVFVDGKPEILEVRAW